MHRRRHLPLIFLCLIPVSVLATDDVPGGNLVLINDNAAWSWFEDERAIVDPVARTLIAGTMADASGANGAVRATVPVSTAG